MKKKKKNSKLKTNKKSDFFSTSYIASSSFFTEKKNMFGSNQFGSSNNNNNNNNNNSNNNRNNANRDNNNNKSIEIDVAGILSSVGEDMCCTQCPWTRYTGGQTEHGHAKTCGGKLVPKSALPVKKRCKNCEAQEGSDQARSIPCRFHPGKQDNWSRTMNMNGPHVTYTWSCCGAKKDYFEQYRGNTKVVVDHDDGCQTKSAHEF